MDLQTTRLLVVPQQIVRFHNFTRTTDKKTIAMKVSFPISSPLLLAASSTNISHAKDVYFSWDLDSVLKNEMSPDCMSVKEARRYSFLAEHSMPGPLIEVNKGDIIHVH